LQGLAAREASEYLQMLITCSNCQSKIKVPDNAAGKKGKCPKCGNVIVIPAAEPPVDEDIAPAPKSSASAFEAPAKKKPAPPPAEEEDYVEEGEPPLPKSKSARDEDEIEDEEYDEQEEEDDDDRPSRKKLKKLKKGPQSIGLSLTSMILGICGVVFGTGGCCVPCLGIWTSPLPFLLGAGAIITGIFGLKKGGTGFAITGLVTGGVGLLEALVAIALFIFGVGGNILANLF
jgi:predicted Zn finger-like uncharacterized protein